MLDHLLARRGGKGNMSRKLRLQEASGPEEPDEVFVRETCSSKMSYGPENNKDKAS